VLLATAGALALLTGGDGGKDKAAPRLSKDEYQDRVLDGSRPFTQAAAKTQNLPAHVTRARDAIRAATQLTQLRKATDKYIQVLQSMRPPADIESVHRRLIGLFKQIRAAIADASAAADLGNDAVYRSTPRRLDRAFQEVENLAPEFQSRGYRRLAL
jgi:hypothetical protein